MLYEVNDVVVYEGSGVYRIIRIGRPDFLNTQDDYYIMQPVCDDGSLLYVKTNNDKVYMRPVISQKEAEELLADFPDMEVLYDGNEKVREKEFRSILKSCECEKYFSMFKGIVGEKNRRNESGKKLSMSDDRNLQRVTKLLFSEFSVVFGISVEQAKDKICSAFQ